MTPQKESPGGGPGPACERTAKTPGQKFTTPASFWKGWGGPASMSPPVHRKPSTPPDTWWKPERKRT